MLGFVASPLGAGLRGLVRRWALSSSGVVETPVAAPPIADIPPPPEPEADRPSVAVLPFVSAGDDRNGEIFADAMTDDIITALGHVPGFFVTYRNYFLGLMVLTVALAIQDKRTEAEVVVERLKSISPDISFDAVRNIWRAINGNPTGERGALINRQIDSLRDIWPT